MITSFAKEKNPFFYHTHTHKKKRKERNLNKQEPIEGNFSFHGNLATPLISKNCTKEWDFISHIIHFSPWNSSCLEFTQNGYTGKSQ